MADYQYGGVPFLEQIAFFIQKLALPTNKWSDVLGKAHDKSFVIAGAINASLLNDMHIALTDAMAIGMTIQEFRKTFESIVAKYGWTGWTGEKTKAGRAWRANIIYETNIRTSYSAGRYQQQQETKESRPYLLYKHSDGVLQPRPIHVTWNGLILPITHKWWRTHYPPNGYGCKCQVFAISKDEMVRRGLHVTPDERIPPGEADKGWGTYPGEDWTPVKGAYHPKINKSRKNFEKGSK
jgi:uncharacterized protein with gpF-like domain